VRGGVSAALAFAIGLDRQLYPRESRKRLQQIASGEWTVDWATGPAADADDSDATAPEMQASLRGVVQVAITDAIKEARAATTYAG